MASQKRWVQTVGVDRPLVRTDIRTVAYISTTVARNSWPEDASVGLYCCCVGSVFSSGGIFEFEADI